MSKKDLDFIPNFYHKFSEIQKFYKKIGMKFESHISYVTCDKIICDICNSLYQKYKNAGISNMYQCLKAHCGHTYFVDFSSDADKLFGDEHPIIGEHLISINFLDEQDYFSGKCLQENAGIYSTADGGSIQFVGTQTIEKCIDYCKNFKYVALWKQSWCNCGNALKQIQPVPDNDCNNKCSGDNTQACGGTGNHYSVYTNKVPEKFNGQCLEDTKDDRIMNIWKEFSGTLTAEVCLDYCKNFKYAGTTGGSWCCCGNELKRTVLYPSASCDIKCAGDQNQSCGGNGMYSVNSPETNVYAIETPQEFVGQCLEDGTDSDNSRIIDRSGFKGQFGDLTIEKCIGLCKGYAYAAVQYAEECWCGNRLNRMKILPDSDCNMKCTGDQTQYCGADKKLNLYTVGKQKPLRPVFKCRFYYILND